MLNIKNIEDMAKKLYEMLPEGLRSVETDLQQQFKDLLQAMFAQMSLVTREEFDVQCKVLLRTREKIDHLQAELDRLIMEKNTAS